MRLSAPPERPVSAANARFGAVGGLGKPPVRWSRYFRGPMPAPALPYVRSLDAVRAGAVLVVMLSHWPHGHWQLAAGWVGVQVFFVLSGFLITRLLLADRTRPLGPFLRRFYWRRTLRIFPLYYGYLLLAGGGLLALAATGAHLSGWLAEGARAARTDGPWLLTYLYNWQDLVHWLDGLPDSHRSRFFNHLWSLSVEEQFYLAYPLLVWWLRPARLRRLLVALVVAGPLVRLGVGEWLRSVPAAPNAWAFFLHRATVFYLDALALGGLLALGVGNGIGRPGRWLAAALAAGAVWNFGWQWGWHEALGRAWPTWRWLGYEHPLEQYVAAARAPSWLRLPWAVLPSVVAAQAALLILWAVRVDTAAPRWLTDGPAAWLGRISYGLYVWHMPLSLLALWEPAYGWLKSGWLSETVGLSTYLLASVGAAAGSYHGFEKIFLRMKDAKKPSARNNSTFTVDV